MDFKLSMTIDMSSYASMMGDEVDMDEYMSGEGMLDEEQQNILKEKGYEVKASAEDYKATIEVTKKYKNIDDISLDKEFEVSVDKITTEEFDEKFFTKSGDVYKSKMVFDLSAADMGDMSELGISKDKMGDYFKFEYRLNLPVKAGKNNATSTENDGKTLVWTLKYGEKNEINYEFNLSKSALAGNKTVIILGIVAAVVVIGVVCCVVVSKKKTSNKKVAE
jgi:hypothetical protein